MALTNRQKVEVAAMIAPLNVHIEKSKHTGLRFFREDRMFEVDELFFLWLCTLF